MANETSSGKTLVANLRGQLFGSMIQRVEDMSSAGIPDVFGIWQGASFWIENKRVKHLPKRLTSTVKPGLEPEQRNWLLALDRAGGTGWVCVRCDTCGWLLIPARDAREAYDGYTLAEWRALAWHANSVEVVASIRTVLSAGRR